MYVNLIFVVVYYNLMLVLWFYSYVFKINFLEFYYLVYIKEINCLLKVDKYVYWCVLIIVYIDICSNLL